MGGQGRSVVGGLGRGAHGAGSGIMISVDNIPVYWKWLYWVVPLPWYIRALAVSEFLASTYDVTMPNGERRGDAFLDLFAFPHDYIWVWCAARRVACCFCCCCAVSTSPPRF